MSENSSTNQTLTVVALSDARERLSEMVDEVSLTGTEFIIAKHGRAMAVLLANEEYESLIETLNILSDNEAMDAIREAQIDLANGDLIELN